MDDLMKYAQELHETNPSLASILDEYSEIERVYIESLQVTGFHSHRKPGTNNTARVTLSVNEFPSSTDEWVINEQTT